MKCDECKWDYPFHMLSPLRTNVNIKDEQGNRKLAEGTTVCGICALALTNAIHGVQRTEFTGRGAEYLRRQAIRWRERNPDSKPEPTESDNDTPRS